MLSVDDAIDRLSAGIEPTEGEVVAIADAFGRVPVATQAVASADVPAFPNSSMDGFAVRSDDGDADRQVVGESRAGGPEAPSVGPGTAVRIMTGAPVPAGADAVVPIEDAVERNGVVQVAEAPEPGTYVRPAGLDIRAGQSVVLPQAQLSAATIALLASMGEPTVAVRRRPRVAIVSTGDELREPGAPLGRGQVYDANGPALAAAVTEAGGEPTRVPPTPDDATVIEAVLREAVKGADLLIVSGGVSVGAHDHVRTVIERLGTLDFWRIAVQPGKPLAFGRVDGTPILGLPGNPVSALVTFELFARPMIRRMLGLAGDGRLRVDARACEAVQKDPGRRAYLRVRLERDGAGYEARSAGGQASSQLLPLATANALLVVPEGASATVPGETYQAILIGGVR